MNLGRHEGRSFGVILIGILETFFLNCGVCRWPVFLQRMDADFDACRSFPAAESEIWEALHWPSFILSFHWTSGSWSRHGHINAGVLACSGSVRYAKGRPQAERNLASGMYDHFNAYHRRDTAVAVHSILPGAVAQDPRCSACASLCMEGCLIICSNEMGQVVKLGT